MATISNVRERFAEKLGIPVSLLERLIRELQLADIVPRAKPGGGVGGYKFTALDLAHVILGFAAMRHVDAPDAVRKLRGLLLRYSHGVPPAVNIALPTLEDQLADWIVDFGQDLRDGGRWLPEDLAVLRSFTIQLCLDPCHAIIDVVGKDGASIQHLYVNDPEAPKPAIRRLTIISGDAILAAAELLVDIETNQNAIATIQSLDRTKPAKASTQEQKSADYLRQEEPTLSSDQPRANGTGSAPAGLSDGNPRKDAFQGKLRRRRVTPSRTKEPTNV